MAPKYHTGQNAILDNHVRLLSQTWATLYIHVIVSVAYNWLVFCLATVRRLYDIANILISLQLIQKVSGAEMKSRKALFMYIGPRKEDMSGMYYLRIFLHLSRLSNISTIFIAFYTVFCIFFIFLYSGPAAILCDSATLNIYFCSNNNNKCRTTLLLWLIVGKKYSQSCRCKDWNLTHFCTLSVHQNVVGVCASVRLWCLYTAFKQTAIYETLVIWPNMWSGCNGTWKNSLSWR